MNETKYFKDALELQVEAKKIGLDWLTTDGIILKLQEETFEVSEEIKKNNKKDSFFTLTSQNNVIASSKSLGKVINYLKKPYLKLVK